MIPGRLVRPVRRAPQALPGRQADGSDRDNRRSWSGGTDRPRGGDGRGGADGVSVTSAVESAGATCTNGGSKFTAGASVTFACNGLDGNGGGASAPTFQKVGPPSWFVAFGTPVVIWSEPGFGDISLRCVGVGGTDVMATNPAGSNAILSVNSLASFALGPGTTSAWFAASGTPRIVAVSTSLSSTAGGVFHPAGETTKTRVLEVAISYAQGCGLLVRNTE